MRFQLCFVAVLALSLLCGSARASAQPRLKSFGFGLILGDPTGLTLKGMLGSANAWDAAIGSSWFGNIQIHGDYLWNIDLFSSRKAGLYMGIGGALGLGRGNGVLVKGKKGNWYYYDDEHATALGVRGVAGLNFAPFNPPVEFFVELAPLFGLTPVTGTGLQVAAGIRYFP